MKLNINIQQHSELIAKFISGEMSDKERIDFEQLVALHPENEQLINELKTDWKLMGGVNLKMPNVDKAWSSMINKLEGENLVDKPMATPVYKMQWVQMAAAMLVVFIVSSVFLLSGIWTKDITIQSSSDPSTLVQTLADGSTIYMKPNTEITYSKKFGNKNRRITLNGEAFFDVASNPNLPFEIVTKEATVRVLGTSFTVKSANEEDFEVVVETGTVSVSAKSNKGQSMIATAGDRVTLSNNHFSKSTAGNKSYQLWKTQRLQFKDETLANIALVINKNYKTNIILESKSLENRKITVTFYNNSVNSIVEVLCAALNLEAQFTENAIVLKESK